MKNVAIFDMKASPADCVTFLAPSSAVCSGSGTDGVGVPMPILLKILVRISSHFFLIWFLTSSRKVLIGLKISSTVPEMLSTGVEK